MWKRSEPVCDLPVVVVCSGNITNAVDLRSLYGLPEAPKKSPAENLLDLYCRVRAQPNLFAALSYLVCSHDCMLHHLLQLRVRLQDLRACSACVPEQKFTWLMQFIKCNVALFWGVTETLNPKLC